MRTTRLLTVSEEGLHPAGSASGGGSASRGALHRGVASGGLHPGRICTQGGWVDLSMNRMTDRCKNITLPQTSFAGGKKSETNQSVFQKHNPQSRITVISENILNSFNQIQLIFKTYTVSNNILKNNAGTLISCLTTTVLSGGSRIFPRGGANSQNCYYFSHFCRKLHENERIWTPGAGGGASLAPPLDPPMVLSHRERTPYSHQWLQNQCYRSRRHHHMVPHSDRQFRSYHFRFQVMPPSKRSSLYPSGCSEQCLLHYRSLPHFRWPEQFSNLVDIFDQGHLS